jgi:arylsulfatase A-like enzyme
MVFGCRPSAFLAAAGCAVIALHCNPTVAAAPKNFIILYGDDQGVGDYFHPGSYLPHVRQLMGSGLWLANHYSNAAICSPSRGALLTSRIPQRLGIYSNKTQAEDSVFSPLSIGGLPLTEVTLANLLGDAGYATAAIGKCKP